MKLVLVNGDLATVERVLARVRFVTVVPMFLHHLKSALAVSTPLGSHLFGMVATIVDLQLIYRWCYYVRLGRFGTIF